MVELPSEETPKIIMDPRMLEFAASDFELETANRKIFLYRRKILSWRNENNETTYLSIKYNGPVKLPPQWRFTATFIDKENFLDIKNSIISVQLPKKGRRSNQVNFTKLKLSKNLDISGTNSLHITTIIVEIGICCLSEKAKIYPILQLERPVDMEIFSDHHQIHRQVDQDPEYSMNDFMEELMQDNPQPPQLELSNVLEPDNFLDLNSSDMSD